MATVPELQQTDRFLADADDFRTMARLHGLATGAPECLAALPLRLAQDGRLRSSFTDLLREAQHKDPEFSLPDALSVLVHAIGGPTASSTRDQALDEATDLTAGFLASLGGWPGPPEEPITDLDNPSPEDPRLAHLYNSSAAAVDPQSNSASEPAAEAPPADNTEELTPPNPLPAITLAEITQALARLERGSVDLRLHLDSIDQRLSRMEPLLEASPAPPANGTHPARTHAEPEHTTPPAPPSPNAAHPEPPRDLVHRGDRPPAIPPIPAPAKDVAPAPAQEAPPRPPTPRRDRFAAAMDLPGSRDSLHFPGRDEAFGLTAAEPPTAPPAAIDVAPSIDVAPIVEPPLPAAHTPPEPLPPPTPTPAASTSQVRQPAPPASLPQPAAAAPACSVPPVTPPATEARKAPQTSPAPGPTQKPIASVTAAPLTVADPAIAPATPPSPAARQASPAAAAPAKPVERKTALPTAAPAAVAPTSTVAPKPAPEPIAEKALPEPSPAPTRKDPQSRANFTFGGTINTAAAAESDRKSTDDEPSPRSRGPLYLFLLAAVLIAVAAFLLLRGKPLPFLLNAPRPTSASPATPSQDNAATTAPTSTDAQNPASPAANANPPTQTSGSSATRNPATGRVLGARQGMEPVEHEQVFATPTFVPEAVMKARLESAPAPLYPRIANAANLEGTVVFEAIIAKDGTVDGLTVLAGQRLLRDAATNAVRQWRFQPFLLRGQPVQVRTILHTHVAPTSADGQPQQ